MNRHIEVLHHGPHGIQFWTYISSHSLRKSSMVLFLAQHADVLDFWRAARRKMRVSVDVVKLDANLLVDVREQPTRKDNGPLLTIGVAEILFDPRKLGFWKSAVALNDLTQLSGSFRGSTEDLLIAAKYVLFFHAIKLQRKLEIVNGGLASQKSAGGSMVPQG